MGTKTNERVKGAVTKPPFSLLFKRQRAYSRVVETKEQAMSQTFAISTAALVLLALFVGPLVLDAVSALQTVAANLN